MKLFRKRKKAENVEIRENVIAEEMPEGGDQPGNRMLDECEQMIEAAKALGVSYKDIIKDIILPQAIRSVLPAIFNEFITLTKETSVVSVIGISDMMKRYSFVVAKTYSPMEPLLVIGIAYIVLNKILSFIGSRLERRLAYD